MPTLGNATLLTPNRATQIAAGTTGTSGATNAALILGLMQTSDFTSNPSLDVGAGAGNQRNLTGSVVVSEGLLIGPTGLSPSSVATSADLVLNAKGTGIVRVGSTGPRVATLNDIPAIPVTSVFGQTGVITAAQGVAAGLAAGIYPSVPLGANTTLSLATHHNHVLNATAAIVLTIPTPGTLTDGFWTCLITDSTHSVTISGALHDLTGALVTSILPSTRAEIEVWGGLVYVITAVAPALTPLSSVVLSGPTTLNSTAHFLRDLYTSSSLTLTVTNAATLGDGFKTCVYTDTGHTVTISGTAYDLAGNLVTTIPPSSKAEIEVWGGQIYAVVTGAITPNTVSQSTLTGTGWLIPLFSASDNSEGITDIKHLADFLASSVSAMRSWDGGAVVANGTTYFTASTPYAGTISSLISKSTTGTFTVAIQINGTSVTGLGAVAVSGSGLTTTAATAANAFNAGDVITGVISSAASSPTDALLNLKIARN